MTSPRSWPRSPAICGASSGRRFRIVRATSGAEALSALKELVSRGEQVALLVADQRMPGLSGTEYLVEARKLVPDAKRVLLTAYADTEAAIQAINEVDLDYYLLKPWDPPEEQLYPVVEDLLTTWEAGAALESGGVRIIGHRFSRDSHDLRDFLARNRVPMRWLDVERDAEARELLRVTDVDGERLPVALLEDGTMLERPTILELAERLGVSAAPASDHYDLAIVGGGPAGLAAAVYGASEGLKTVMVEKDAPGGQAGTSSRIENYLGFPAGAERLRPRAPRDRPGAPPRGRAAVDPGRDRAARRGRRADRRALRRRHALAPTASSSPPASPTTSSTRRGSTPSPARASTTARR